MARRTALAYLGLGLLWILGSDGFLLVTGRLDAAAFVSEAVKGIVYVAASALVVYLLIRFLPARNRWLPVLVSAAYLLAGLAWILGSDLYLHETGRLSAGALSTQVIKGSAFVVVSAFAIFLLAEVFGRQSGPATGIAGESSRDPPRWDRFLPIRLALMFSVIVFGLSLLLDIYRLTVDETITRPEFLEHLVESLFLTTFAGATLYLLLHYFIQTALRASRSESDSRQRYRSLFAHNPSAVFLLGKDGRFVDANTALCRLVGLPAEKVIGEPWEPMAEPGEVAHIRERFRATLEGEPQTFETRARRPDGTTLHVQATFIPRYQNGTVTGVYGVARDITSEKTARDRIAASEERFRALFEHSLDAVFLTRPDGTIESANPAAETMLGLGHDEILERGRDGVVDTTDPAFVDILAERNRTGNARGILRLIRGDGTTFPAEITASRYEDPGGTLLSFITARDISEQARYEAEIRESEERHRALFEQSLDAVFLTRPDGSIEAANPAAQAMLGYSEAEIIELGRSGIVDTSDPTLERMVSEREATGQARGVLRFRHADGSTFPAETTSARFTDAAGRTYAFVVAHDISERERRRVALQESEARHRAIFENSMDGMFLLTSDGEILGANPAAREIFRMTEEELRAKGRAGITDASDPAVRRSVEERQRTGQSRAVIRMIRGDGEVFPAEINATQFEVGTGEQLVSVMVRDLTETKERERQLAASEARMRAVFDHSMDAIVLSAPDEGQLLECNAAAERLFGLPEAELKRSHRDQMFDSKDPALAEFIRERNTSGHARGVLTAFRADGSPVPVEATTSVFEDERGNRRSSVILRDISESLRREQALRESEDRYRALFENSTDAILIGSPEGRAFDANPAAEHLFGLSREELCDLDRKDMLDPDDPDFQKLRDERLREGRARAELNLRRGDGTWFLADVTAVGFKNLEGDERTSIVIRDITESKRQEQALQESEERFRSIFEHSPDAILNLDPETGRILTVNAAAERLFGLDKDALRALERSDHSDVTDPAFQAFLEERNRTGHARATLTMFRGDGTGFPADVTSGVYYDSDGRAWATAIVRDITRQREWEAEIRASEERYRALFEQSLDAIFITEAETLDLVGANPAAQALFGMTEDELCARPAEKAMDMGDPATREYFATRERDGQARARLRMRRGDGTWFMAEVTSRLFHSAAGRLMANTIIRDITEEEAYERQLAESEQRFRIVADNTGQVIYELDLETGERVWAGACLEMFGYDHDDLQAMSARERLMHTPADERERVAAQYRKAARAGGGFYFDYPLKTRDGRTILVEDRGIVLKDLGRMYGVIQDVTEKRRLLSELEAREQSLVEVSRVQQAILDALSAHIALLDRGGVVQYVNTAWRRFAEDNGYPGTDAGVGSNYLNVCDATRGRDREAARQTARGIRQVMAGERDSFEIEYPCHSPAERRWFRVSVTPFRAGDRSGAVVAHVDISDRREAERQLELVATAFRSADEAMIICNADFEILDVNRAYERILGRDRDDAIGSRPLFLEIEQQERNIRRALESEGQWRGELLQRRLDGQAFVSRASVSEVPDPESGTPHLVVSFSDISELREYERRVDYLSYHDPLTGLPNRGALEEWFQGFEPGPDAAGEVSRLAFVFIDLDRLKTVNDAYGHSVGDELIVELGRRLLAVCEVDDYVARLIGDEFVMVIGGVSDGGEAMAEVHRRLETVSAPFKRGEFMVHPTVCAGIALAPEHGTSLEQLLRKADVAMHEAKTQGRGETVLFSAEMSEEVEEQILIERQLRGGIDNREFLLHYQPSVELETGRIIGVEALVRWENPQLGLVPPDRFIPVAEDSGLIIELGGWVFEEVCRQISEWQSEDVPFGWIAVNLSPIQFQDPNLLQKISDCMDRHGVTGDRIRVEITENVLVMDPNWTTSVLESLRDLGIRVAVDDFGTGYSSLAYLKRFPVDFVKLDKTFIAGLPEDSADASIVASVVDLARRLGMGVVAEGIERDEQRRFLLEAGCLEAQGYFFSLPLRSADLPWLLTSHQILPVATAAE